MVDKKASDLFFTTFAPVMIKIDVKILPVNQMKLTPKMVWQAALELMNESQLEEFTRELEIDFAVSEVQRQSVADDFGVHRPLHHCVRHGGEVGHLAAVPGPALPLFREVVDALHLPHRLHLLAEQTVPDFPKFRGFYFYDLKKII